MKALDVFGLLAAVLTAGALVTPSASAGPICRVGYVWRGAYFVDTVCVTPAERALAATQNSLAPQRKQIFTDGCKQGFVWREATGIASDKVCVTPAERDAAARQNAANLAHSAQAGECRPGFVWREAFANDRVCVPPAERALSGVQNGLGPKRKLLFSASCLQGFVWREASENHDDKVCIPPAERALIKNQDEWHKSRAY